jgi:hypothetical protein
MIIWKFLHITAMFATVSVFVGQGLLSNGIARSRDVRSIRRTLAVEERFAPIGGALFVSGIVFGVITALTGDLDLTAPWLLISYGIVAVIFATGIGYHGPRGRKLKALADASPEDEPSETLRQAIEAPSARVVTAVDGLLWVAVIFTMVAKPFG